MRKIAITIVALVLAGCARPPAPAPSVPIPPAPPRGEPSAFIGISETALRAHLGSPAFIRKDGATEMWRFDGPACHAYFFLTGTAPAQLVRHVETMPVGKDSSADAACLSGLKKTP